jgi:RNA polymerase sigma-70 factor (ECF subfamily)
LSDELFALHQRLMSGERTASEELARQLLEPLCARVQRSYPHVDEQIVADGVIDAVLEYCAAPQHTSVRTGEELRAQLATAAWRNVANAVRGQRRRRQREERFGRTLASADVEVGGSLGKLIDEEEEAVRHERVEALMSLCADESDRRVLRLRLAGERRTEAFAQALGLENLPAPEQRRLVKRAKDRIDKMIRRNEQTRKG